MVGDKLTAIDFAYFAMFIALLLNEHGKHPELQEALKASIAGLVNTNAWLDRMRAELADYLAARPARFA